MEGTDKHEILEAIGSLAEQTRELKEGRTEILEAIQSFATSVDERFDRLEGRTAKIEGHLTKIDGRTAKIEATMVTKDYLDDKLADFYSDIVNFVKRRVPSWREAV